MPKTIIKISFLCKLIFYQKKTKNFESQRFPNTLLNKQEQKFNSNFGPSSLRLNDDSNKILIDWHELLNENTKLN
ncbi:hypothetical protein BpHYR1_008823 [Brachionus plicatilis]|uniref:Uncharacterized protein n=1 Tax=Brachionus plicatilis TaxID=10195 RepID=A0A3M7R6R3_BRAPC|nr:hypothetical protein BpHYR1_008823 [Brachionus plicatilis]